MDQTAIATPPRGVAQKTDAVLGAICEGHRRVGAIAAATSLPHSTVIRAAALLRDLGKIGVVLDEGPLFSPVPGTSSA